MNATRQQEFLCPHCSHINTLEINPAKEMYIERQVACSRCNTVVEVVPADGIGEQINLIVSVTSSEMPIR
ncbi:hypothetical protein [Aestuariibacter sp. A3R04]|uniref:hypothetical protein n=1 Tax=Aestuariibacter sp. A3R04 TaxID=2841571 RepID=UPI001C08AF31|nr:hypothetical protein [Aestuariibacter sp. A3R04]MBU3023571.1 hypothetical protein [Aestuariibacter sp. A3R04]